MKLIDSYQFMVEMLQRIDCLGFFQELQGGYMDVARKFALNYDGVQTKVGPLEFFCLRQNNFKHHKDAQGW